MASFNGHISTNPDTPAEIRARAARNLVKERARISRLTDGDVAKIMGRVIAKVLMERDAVTEADFLQAGIPQDRIAANTDAAWRHARRIENRLDAKVALQ